MVHSGASGTFSIFSQSASSDKMSFKVHGEKNARNSHFGLNQVAVVVALPRRKVLIRTSGFR